MYHENFRNILTCVHDCLFIQNSLLINGLLNSRFETGHFCCGIVYDAFVDDSFGLFVNLDLTNRDSVNNTFTISNLHVCNPPC